MDGRFSIRAGLAVGVLCANTALADPLILTYSGPSYNAVATLNTISNGNGSLSAVTGSLIVTGGAAAGSYALFTNPAGTAPSISPSGYFQYDNQVFPSLSPVLNLNGLLFISGATEINIWGNGVGNPDTFYAHGPGGNVSESGATTLVPAPGTAMLTAGGLGLVLTRRRRRA